MPKHHQSKAAPAPAAKQTFRKTTPLVVQQHPRQPVAPPKPQPAQPAVQAKPAARANNAGGAVTSSALQRAAQIRATAVNSGARAGGKPCACAKFR